MTLRYAVQTVACLIGVGIALPGCYHAALNLDR